LTTAEFSALDLKLLQAKSNRHLLRLALAFCLALFCGLVAQENWPGSVVALAPLSLLAMLLVNQNKFAWNRSAALAAIVSGIAVLAVAIEPGPLNLCVVWLSLAGLAVTRQNLALTNLYEIIKTAAHTLFATPAQLMKDISAHRAIRDQLHAHPRLLSIANVFLPILAIITFGTLLAIANPLIETSLVNLSWGAPWKFALSWAPFVTVLSFFMIWSVAHMVPRREQNTLIGPRNLWGKKFAAIGSVSITLLALNAMFAFENLLDFKYIWQGEALPSGMNYADYVHRGSYTLIATAILAGALVLFALQPESNTEKSKLVRWLVYAWTAQNLALVASSAMRTLNYIDAYGMTLWRLAGLIWMALVAAGLALIMLRIITQRGHLWLVNTNLGVAFMVLMLCGFIDFNGYVANWNVERYHQQRGLDIDYLRSLGPSALPAVRQLQTTELQPDQYSISANLLENELRDMQSDWRRWSLRGAWLQKAKRDIMQTEDRR
jgi:Domain of unknown function (DUF4173)